MSASPCELMPAGFLSLTGSGSRLSEEEYSDDEDSSWKVRRAAAKCLAAIIAEYPDQLARIYKEAAPALLARFREREENVKAEVFAAFVELVAQVEAAGQGNDESSGALGVLQADESSILKACARQLKEKSLKTKMCVFQLLRRLVLVLPSSTASHADLLVPGILAALSVLGLCCLYRTMTR